MYVILFWTFYQKAGPVVACVMKVFCSLVRARDCRTTVRFVNRIFFEELYFARFGKISGKVLYDESTNGYNSFPCT